MYFQFYIWKTREIFQKTRIIGLVHTRDTKETIESGPLCITDLFQNETETYF